MAKHPTKALGISYIGNKWAHMTMFAQALPQRPKSYLDLTFGCGICSVFMQELGVRNFVSNDISPYPRLIAEALLGTNAKRLTDAEIRQRLEPQYHPGWLAENVPTKAIRHRTACAVDGLILANQDSPLILIAIGAVLSTGAMGYFRYGSMKVLTPKTFTELVYSKAIRLNARVAEGCTTRITTIDYLNIDKSLSSLKDFVCYLDPAWPAQPEAGRQHVGNDKVYGFYASVLMSALRQEDLPMPAEYNVSLDDFYKGMRRTIKLLKKRNTVLIAYQSRPDVVEEVKDRLFGNLAVAEFKEQRTSGTKLWEYLWRVE